MSWRWIIYKYIHTSLQELEFKCYTLNSAVCGKRNNQIWPLARKHICVVSYKNMHHRNLWSCTLLSFCRSVISSLCHQPCIIPTLWPCTMFSFCHSVTFSLCHQPCIYLPSGQAHLCNSVILSFSHSVANPVYCLPSCHSVIFSLRCQPCIYLPTLWPSTLL